MPFSMLLVIVACICFYRLGRFDATHPGQLWTRCMLAWNWLRTRRRALVDADAGLAFHRPWASHRARAYARRAWRFLQCHLAGLCGRAHCDGAPALRGERQPGANAAPHSAPPAAAVRLRRQCARRLGVLRLRAAGSAFAPHVRNLRRLRSGAASAGILRECGPFGTPLFSALACPRRDCYKNDFLFGRLSAGVGS